MNYRYAACCAALAAAAFAQTASSPTAALVQLSPTTVSFATQAVGQISPPLPVRVLNAGPAPVTITTWRVQGEAFHVAAARVPLTLAPGVWSQITLKFSSATPGSFSGSLEALTANGAATAPVALAGTAAQPRVTVSGATFGTQSAGWTSPLRTVLVRNPGVVPATISQASLSGTAFSIYSISHLPVTLNPGAATGITVAFTPPSAGNYSASLSLSGPGGLAVEAPLSGSGAGVPALSIAALPQLAHLGQAAAFGLAAAGGTPPYRFNLYWSSGVLPPGLSLSADGQISGTPTQAGTYPVLVQAADSSPSPLYATALISIRVAPISLDAYGGIVQQPCPAQAHFSTAKINGRWWLCTPAGHVFWMKSVYDAAANDAGVDHEGIAQSKLIQDKYATGPTANATLNWSLATVRRLKAWGFNALSEYAVGWTLPIGINSNWHTADQAIPVKLPFVAFVAPSLYALTNQGGYAAQPAKDLLAGVRSDVFTGYRSHITDAFDPNWRQWLVKEMATDPWIQKAIAGRNHDYLIGINVDDTDDLEGFGAGPDFPTINNGLVAPGYQQPDLSWMVLVTSPVQSANARQGASYPDATVYAKQALSQWLSRRYGGNIAALNAAWGSAYTSFGSAGGWGAGPGLLDEDGTCPAARLQTAPPPCWVPRDAYTLAGASPGLRQDLNDFLLYYAQQYFSTVKAVLQQAAPGVLYLGPTTLGTWGAPPRRQVLQAAAASVDVIMLPSLPVDCSNCTDQQQRLDFVAQWGGDKPWMDWEGYQSRADSYMAPFASSSDELTSQAARGALYQKRLDQILDARDTATGTYHLVGLKWWALYDSRGEKANWGLLTRRDDPYDGTGASTRPGIGVAGYPTGCLSGFGCEQASYGNFLGPVAAANQGVYLRLLGLE